MSSSKLLQPMVGTDVTSTAGRSLCVVLLTGLTVVCCTAPQALAARPQESEKARQLEPALSNTPTWVIAKHTIIFEGNTVVDWDHVTRSLAQLGAREGKVKATFRFTSGARDKFQPMQQKIFKVLRQQPRSIPMSVGFGGRAELDKVRIQADLKPDGKLRILGRALTPTGKPAAGAEVVVLPKTDNPSKFVYLTGPRLRNRTDHDFREAKPSGGFVIHPSAGAHVLVLHKSGFALLTGTALQKSPTFRLQAWAKVSGNVAETPGYEQRITFTAQPKLPFTFLFYDIKLDADRNYQTVVPPGHVAALRSVKTGNGSGMGKGTADWTLKPGEIIKFDLKPMSDFEVEGIELHKKQMNALRGGPKLSAEDVKRIGERARIEIRQRKEREAEKQDKGELYDRASPRQNEDEIRRGMAELKKRIDEVATSRRKLESELIKLEIELSAMRARKQVAESWRGSVLGRVVWQSSIPRLEPVAVNKDPEVFGNSVPDRSLVVNEDSRSVANVFVYLAKAPEGYTPSDEELPPRTFGLGRLGFTPRALVIRTGQPVQYVNQTKVAGDFHSYPAYNQQHNMMVGPGDLTGRTKTIYRKSERFPIRIGSDFHAWMSGWHLPLDHPFAAVTDANGRFVIRNLPPGDYEFKVWHETVGYLAPLKVTVPKTAPEQRSLHTIRLSNRVLAETLTRHYNAAVKKHGAANSHATALDAKRKLWEARTGKKSDAPE